MAQPGFQWWHPRGHSYGLGAIGDTPPQNAQYGTFGKECCGRPKSCYACQNLQNIELIGEIVR